MRIAMIASEANPLAKTGGLADVVYSLSKELVKLEQEVIIVLPYYGNIKGTIKQGVELVCSYYVRMSWRNAEARIFKTIIDGITYYLIDNEQYFNRGHLYGDYDDGERFAFFTLAAKELFSHINFRPHIIHIHDWQAGMLPCLVKEEKPISRYFEKTKFVLTIHNPAFQGLYSKSVLGDLYGLDDPLYDTGIVRFDGQVSTLKSAIIYADKITTVSPTHRNELLSPEGSMGLWSVMRLREWDFAGFLNGIDIDEFNPNNPAKIAYPYTIRNRKSGKNKNKQKFLLEKGLKNPTAPLFGLVSRLTWQKGVDILLPVCYELVNKGANLAILGSGEYNVEIELEKLRARYPDQVSIYIGYNEEVAQQIYACSDFFLMPSLFEPCGISQLIALRYGSLPIVRETGGLKDSVIGYNGFNLKEATGFSFINYDVESFKNACNYALDVYNDSNVFETLKKNAMNADFSWERSAKLYLGLYESIRR